MTQRGLMTCGRARFDPALRATYTPPATASGQPVVYGGFNTPVSLPAIPGLKVAVAHHRGGLYAMGHLQSLPPAGSEGFASGRSESNPSFAAYPDFWEPSPGWGAPNSLIRRPRVCIVLASWANGASNAAVRRDNASAQLGLLWPQLKALGVTLCLSGSARAASCPIAAACPALTFAATQLANLPEAGRIHRTTATYGAATSLVGGDVLIVELSQDRSSFGGVGESVSILYHPQRLNYAHAGNANVTGTIPAGVRYWSGLTVAGSGGAIPVGFYTYPVSAAADLVPAQALAARCRRYGHHVYQLSRLPPGTEDSGGTYNATAIYESLYAGVPGRQRTLIPTTTDPAAVFAVVGPAIVSFFS